MHESTKTEKIMYKATLDRLNSLFPQIFSEYSVLLENGAQGSFDFLCEQNGIKTGFEIMCRPSKGKLKEKLRYLGYVDKYVFVLPLESLQFYRRHAKFFTPLTRPKFFSEDFASKKLFVWICSLSEQRIVQEEKFSRFFNVSKKSNK